MRRRGRTIIGGDVYKRRVREEQKRTQKYMAIGN